jgi:SAM-dependent methyltransferase
MTVSRTDVVKQQVAAHWDRRALHFDEDFGHSIRTPAERAAWDRIFDLVLAGRGVLHALDAGCGTGFLSFELATRGHHLTQADAEQLPFRAGTFGLVISRHLLWTLSHPGAAIDDWIRVLRPGGRLVIVDSQIIPGTAPPPGENARMSPEYEAVCDQLPFFGGRAREEIEALLREHGLVHVDSDPLHDLVVAQEQRMADEGRARQTRRRYVVWGDREPTRADQVIE